MISVRGFPCVFSSSYLHAFIRFVSRGFSHSFNGFAFIDLTIYCFTRLYFAFTLRELISSLRFLGVYNYLIQMPTLAQVFAIFSVPVFLTFFAIRQRQGTAKARKSRGRVLSLPVVP